MYIYVFIKSLIRRLLTDNISFLAGGVAFYGLLALFPAMAATVSIFGLFADPVSVREHLDAVQTLFPANVYLLLNKQLDLLVSESSTKLSLTFIVSILLTIFSATRGTKAMLASLNVVFRISESRTWWFRQVQSFILTFGSLILMVIAILVVIATPIAMRLLPDIMTDNVIPSINQIRWTLLFGALFLGLSFLFAWGPNRPIRDTTRKSVFIGAFIATFMWLMISVGGSYLVQIIPNIQGAYGSLSAIVGLMMWIYMSAYAVLAGAAVTASLEAMNRVEASSETEITA